MKNPVVKSRKVPSLKDISLGDKVKILSMKPNHYPDIVGKKARVRFISQSSMFPETSTTGLDKFHGRVMVKSGDQKKHFFIHNAKLKILKDE